MIATPIQSIPAAPAPTFPEQVTGMYILAESLRRLGLNTVYGLVGIPVTEAAFAMQRVGIKFVGFRFEQQAGMAAATHGYLTRTPGILLTVSSLGFLNGLTATANATVNCYPMIQISGATDPAMVGMNMGTYEELDQLATAKPLVKAAFRCSRAADIPVAVARAYRAAVSGRPGGVYIDMATPALGEVVNAADIEPLFRKPVDIYSPVAPNVEAVKRAVQLIASARKPIVVLGKGAAYAQADARLLSLVNSYQLPYLPMSMAKGLLPDDGPLSAVACRSMAMQQADVVILIGARLNWMLSFGKGKWNPNAKFVQLDVEPQEIDVNRQIDAPVVGDIALSLDALLSTLKGVALQTDPAWLSSLQQQAQAAKAKLASQLLAESTKMPMTHRGALSAIKPILEQHPEVILINEGANTLDETRAAVNQSTPRSRIDCATWAIMGMGLGSAIGAAVATGRSVVAVMGDSAFGFSGMDFSTVCRHRLPCTVVIFNNGGIYNGIGVNPSGDSDPAPSTLDINARYDKFGEAFGAITFYVASPDELSKALTAAIESRQPCLIHAQLAADSGKESGHIGYLNPAPLINYQV